MAIDAALPQSVVDALEDVVFATDVAGRLTYLNPAWTTLTGHLVEDALGTPLEQHLTAGPGAEARCLTAYGGVRWVHVRRSALPDGGTCGVLTDVTDRRREATRVAEAEARFRGAFDHAAAGMAIVATDGRTLRVNRALSELLGRPPEELLELTVADVTHADDLAAELVQWERLVAGEIRDYEIEKRLLRPDGALLWVRQAVALVRGHDGAPLYAVSQLHDVTAARRAAERLARGLLHDDGTGLPNAELFHDRLDQALRRTRRSGRRVGVLRCTIGGASVEEAAARLQDTLRPGDTVARVGEEELAILLDALRDDDEAHLVAARVEAELSKPPALRLRIGIATAGEGEGAARDLVADAAARAQGVEESRMQRDLRRAQELGELRLAFQPVVALADGRLAGLEALLRWDDPRAGERLPGEFLAAAAAAGLLEPFGEWVVREGCRALAAWRAQGLAEDLTLAVNLSAVELRRGDLADVVADALRSAGLPACALRLEVAEDAIGPASLPALRALARVGVSLAVDDFGAGGAAFAYVARVPGLTEIKVDRSLVHRVGETREDAAVLAAVISLGRSLGVGVVAEGLESAAEVRLLRDLGCTLGQGFWFGRPQPAAEVEQLLRRASHGELGI